MNFDGKFAEQILPEELHRISLSFLVDELEIHHGGTGAGIAYGIASLGLRPLLVGSVGRDFRKDYQPWLEDHGVDTSWVRESDRHHTARFVATKDTELNQLASFYAGAMTEAKEIELAPIADHVGGLDLVVISPNDPEAMLRHTDECRKRGFPFLADPSQQVAIMDGEQLRRLVDGAAYLFSNDYEKALIEQKTGWSSDEILSRVGVRVTTLGADGATVERRGEPELRVPAVATDQQRDPTGAGDALRAGFIPGLAWGLSLERCVQMGCLLGTYALESVGPQEYEIGRERFLERFTRAYGAEAAAEVGKRISCRLP